MSGTTFLVDIGNRRGPSFRRLDDALRFAAEREGAVITVRDGDGRTSSLISYLNRERLKQAAERDAID